MACLTRPPLWLDEILQLLGTRDRRIDDSMRWVRDNPGGVPLGYLTQQATIHVLGFSVFSARLPAALFSVLSCIALAWLLEELDVPAPRLTLLLFASMPLQFRYALEARPYSQALFFSIVATALFVRLLRRPCLGTAGLYSLSVAAGLYTQPYLLFTQIGQVAWAAFCAPRRALAPIAAGAALSTAGLLFAPWYLHARSHWALSVQNAGLNFAPGPATLLQAVRELSGGGYACSVPLLCAALLAVKSRCNGMLAPLAIGMASAVAGALLADQVSGYFFAARQLIYLAPGLVIGAALWIALLQRNHPVAARALTLLLIGPLVVQDWRMLRKSRENWALAATALKSAVDLGGCVEMIPQRSSPDLYAFFEPTLRNHLCPVGRIVELHVIAASTPYTQSADEMRAVKELRSEGFRLQRVDAIGRMHLFYWDRPP